MNFTVRKAKPTENLSITRTLAYAFEKDFSRLTKDMERVAKAFETGIATNRFIVAEQNGEIIGIAGCADCTGRVLNVSKRDSRKHFGLIRGTIAHMAFRGEFMNQLDFPPTTGVIDFVGVLPKSRGQGVATALLEKVVESNPKYTEFVLNVKDNNYSAIRVYERFGFVEYERVPYKWAKQVGFKELVWMRYVVGKAVRDV